MTESDDMSGFLFLLTKYTIKDTDTRTMKRAAGPTTYGLRQIGGGLIKRGVPAAIVGFAAMVLIIIIL